MKVKVLILSLVIGIVPMSAVLAHAEGGSSGSGSTPTSTPTPTKTEDSADGTPTPTPTTEAEHDLTNRLEKAKNTLKLNLAAAEKLKIEDKCEGAQKNVGKVKSKLDNIANIRGKSYEALSKRVDNLVTRLKAQGVDTTDLENERVQLGAKITQVKTDITAYRQTMADIAGMTCKSDPTGFKALLTQARTQRDTIATDAKAIKDYFQGTIKPTLQDIRDQLEAAKPTPTPSTEGAQ